jgi:hypothetical protein
MPNKTTAEIRDLIDSAAAFKRQEMEANANRKKLEAEIVAALKLEDAKTVKQFGAASKVEIYFRKTRKFDQVKIELFRKEAGDAVFGEFFKPKWEPSLPAGKFDSLVQNHQYGPWVAGTFIDAPPVPGFKYEFGEE